MIAVKKQRQGDGFEEEVKKKFYPLLRLGLLQRKHAIGEMLRKTITVDDKDIEHCTMLISIDGRRDRLIYLLGDNSFASRILLDVPLEYDGHPNYIKTRDAIYDVLSHEIIPGNENV